MSSELDRSALGVRYLLGELSAEEEQQFEQAFFQDDGLLEDLQITEAEVVDAYVAGELEDVPRKHFERTLAASSRLRQRVKFAETWAHSERRNSTPVVPAPEPWWRKPFTVPFAHQPASVWALAATVVAILAIAVAVVQSVRLRNERQRVEAERAEIARQREELSQAAQGNQRKDELLKALQEHIEKSDEHKLASDERPVKTPKSTFASITLIPGSLRSAGESKELKIPAGASEVRIELALPFVDYRSYRVTIRGPADKEIRRDGLRQTRSKTIELRLPATSFSAGDYTVNVSGVATNGAVEPVSDYAFRIVQK